MHDNIAKKRSKSLVIPTGKTTDHNYGLQIFSRYYTFIKVDRFEGILNQIQIDGMLNDHSSSCNS